MAKGLICDRCGQVFTEYRKMNDFEIFPYSGIKTVNQSKVISYDLCKDCTETVIQYINNEVQMVLFTDKETPDEAESDTGADRHI